MPLPVGAQGLWTDASDIRAITGRGDMLFAATGGGLLTWTQPHDHPQLFGTIHGIPSNNILGVHLHDAYDELLLRTDNGIARGWPASQWETLFAEPHGAGRSFSSALSLPNGAWLLGGDSGELVAWKQSHTERLTIPTHSGVVDLDYSVTWDALLGLPKTTVRSKQTASLFPSGLLCATQDDGLWLLRSVQPPRWLRIGAIEGLPSDQLLQVAVDDSSNIWLGTRAGIAKLDLQLHVDSWPDDPYLTQRALTMFTAPSSHIYAGWWGGLFRIVTVAYDDALHKSEVPTVELMPGIDEAIVSTTWAHGLWWTGGDSLESYLGARLHPPIGLADNNVLSLASHGDDIWLGHPAGQLSRVQTQPGNIGLRSFETWQHFSPQDGLPQSNLNCLWFHAGTLFVGSGAGLFQQSGLGTGPRFRPVEQLPPEEVRAQATWHGSHWVGGEAGLWESDGSGWWQIPLWPGASEVRSISATAETLWVTAGFGGVAARVGREWRVPRLDSMLAGVSFEHLTVSDPGIAYASTNRGVVIIDRNQASLLEPASPTDVQCLLWQGSSLYAGTPQGLHAWTAGRNWQSWSVVDRLPGSYVHTLATAPMPFILVGTKRGGGLFAVEPETTDTPVEARSTSPSSNVCLIASRQGDRLVVRVPYEDAKSMRLYDIRGRYLDDWELVETGLLEGSASSRTGQRIRKGIYLGWIRVPQGKSHSVRVLVTP